MLCDTLLVSFMSLSRSPDCVKSVCLWVELVAGAADGEKLSEVCVVCADDAGSLETDCDVIA